MGVLAGSARLAVDDVDGAMTVPLILNDIHVMPVVQALVACLCQQLTRTPRGPVCHCCVVWGDQPPPADVCGCDCVVGTPPVAGSGQAWARIVGITYGGRCPGGITVDVELGVLRCVTAQPDEVTGVVDCAAAEADAVAFAADMAALRRAPKCCAALGDKTWRVANVLPVGPAGGCAGSIARVGIDMADCPCPPPVEA